MLLCHVTVICKRTCVYVNPIKHITMRMNNPADLHFIEMWRQTGAAAQLNSVWVLVTNATQSLELACAPICWLTSWLVGFCQTGIICSNYLLCNDSAAKDNDLTFFTFYFYMRILIVCEALRFACVRVRWYLFIIFFHIFAFLCTFFYEYYICINGVASLVLATHTNRAATK